MSVPTSAAVRPVVDIGRRTVNSCLSAVFGHLKSLPLTSDFDNSRLENPFSVHVPIVFNHNGNDRNSCVDGKMEATFLEGEHIGFLGQEASAFWKHPQ